ncbi:putative Ig domain-containing protein, partial [Pedobacter steynii]
MKWTADVAYPAGTEIIVYCKYTLTAKDIHNTPRGTIAVAQQSYNTSSGAVNPQEQMSLAEFSGDQLFAFTGSISSPNFLAGMSINKPVASPWEASLLPTTFGADKSVLPSALSSSGAQKLAISFADPSDPFVNAAPVARYKREDIGNATGLPSELLTKISDPSKWEIRSDGYYYDPLFSAATPIVVTGILITAQPVNRTNLCPGSATSFSITASGVCSYQWEVSDDGTTFTPIVASGIYSGVTTATLNISNITGLNTKKYRVKVSGANGTTSDIVNFTLVNPVITLNADPLPQATPNIAYTTTVQVTSGGNGTFAFSLESGALPGGLTLNTASGEISGTPNMGGQFNFVIKATDNCSTPNTGTQSYSIIVGTVDQSITLTDYTKIYGDGTFTLPLNSSAGLPVTYTSSAPTVATVVGNTVTIIGAGSTNITATQAGNTSYNPAPMVEKTITVNKKNITLALNATPLISKVYDGNTTATLVPANYSLTGVLG